MVRTDQLASAAHADPAAVAADVILYHFPGAICAQKVRLALAEKGVAWESRIVTGNDPIAGLRSAQYLSLNPNGVVPTFVHGNHVLVESRIISEYVEEAFAGCRLMPSDPPNRHLARLWSKQIDDGLHLYVYVLSFIVTMRERYLSMPRDDWSTRLPGLRDPVKREWTMDLLERGDASPYVVLALQRFRRLLREMAAALASTPWLAGQDYSLADADYTAYLHRLGELGLEFLWSDLQPVSDWWRRVTKRPSYHIAIVDWIGDTERASREAAGNLASSRFRELMPGVE